MEEDKDYVPSEVNILPSQETEEVSNPFRNPSNQRLLKALFFETVGADKSTVLYTLKDKDHMGFPSLYRLYMEMEDLTEYEFANKYLDGWQHWTMLSECGWFAPFVKRWREELHLKFSARALNRIKRTSMSDNRDALDANKYLLERKWEPKGDSKAGRPSKEAIKREAHNLFEEAKTVNEDAKRLGLN